MTAPQPGPMRFARPHSVEQAVALLAAGAWRPLAGGTDIYPAAVDAPAPDGLLDLGRVDALRGLREATAPDGAPGWWLGATTTWSDLARAALPPALVALAQVAREVGGVQVQNRGTIGGNLCNASPAADGIPVLMALDAVAVLRSVEGERRVPVTDFVLGPRRTVRRHDELLLGLWLPRRSAGAGSRFVKAGHRRYLVISIAMVAVALDFDQHERTASCGIAVGACGPRALRLRELEAALLTTPRVELGDRAGTVVNGRALACLSPLDDVRGTAAYRREAVAEMLVRLLSEASLRAAA